MGKALAIAGAGIADLPIDRQPGTLGWLKLKVAVWETVNQYIQSGFDVFYADIKTGTDLLCWEALTDARDEYQGPLALIAVRSHAEKGNRLSRLERLAKALAAVEADRIVDTNDISECCRYMTEKADAALCIFRQGIDCPAAWLLQDARKKKKEIAVLDPVTLEKTALPV